MNGASILWVGAAFLGFMVWWPIGVAFLTAITVTAISQQLTGYRHDPGGGGSIHIGEATSFDQYKNATLHKIEADQAEIRAITDRLRKAKTPAEFNRLIGAQRQLKGY